MPQSLKASTPSVPINTGMKYRPIPTPSLQPLYQKDSGYIYFFINAHERSETHVKLFLYQSGLYINRSNGINLRAYSHSGRLNCVNEVVQATGVKYRTHIRLAYSLGQETRWNIQLATTKWLLRQPESESSVTRAKTEILKHYRAYLQSFYPSAALERWQPDDASNI